MPEDVEEAVALEDVFPEVPGAVAGRMLRVACAALHLARMAAAVEGQEDRARAAQPRGHVDFVGVSGKVDQGARLEREQRRARVAVLLVLPHGVAPVLAGAGILELAGRHRQAVHREQQIHRVVLARMAGHLARDRELVLVVERQHLVVQPVRRLEVREAEGLAVELEAVPQYVQRALEVELLDQRTDQQLLQSRGVQGTHLGPELRLRRLQEGAHPRGKERALDVPFRICAGLPTALLVQHFLDVCLEGALVGLRHAVFTIRMAEMLRKRGT